MLANALQNAGIDSPTDNEAYGEVRCKRSETVKYIKLLLYKKAREQQQPPPVPVASAQTAAAAAAAAGGGGDADGDGDFAVVEGDGVADGADFTAA